MPNLNNTILTDKHYYAQTLFNINEIKKDIDLKHAKDEISENQADEVSVIWNYLFAGLIREGLKYDYISAQNSERDIIRITMDNVQFDCYAKDLKDIFKNEYSILINKENCNLNIEQHDISLGAEGSSIKSEKEIQLENELKELKAKTSEQIKQLQYTINHDAPTGLKNKKAYAEAIKELLPPYTIISVDVNNLKETNDNYGHQAGDTLLKNTAIALTTYFKHSCYRTGGDEFIIITKNMENATVENNLNNALKALQQIDDGLLYSFSYGYATNAEADTPNDVFKIADKRMYDNKTAYKKKNNIPPRGTTYITEIPKENKIIEYNNKYEQYKDIDTFIYDAYEMTLIPPGGTIGDKVRAIVAPLYIYENNNHVPIMVVMVNKMGIYEAFISESEEKPTIQFNFDDNSYLVRGFFVDGKFQSRILLSGETLSMGYNLNKDNHIEYRSNSAEKTGYGHVTLNFQDRIFHIVPLSRNNNEHGIVQCIAGIINPDKSSVVIITNPNGYTSFVGLDQNKYQLLTYWQEDVLCAEIIAQR